MTGIWVVVHVRAISWFLMNGVENGWDEFVDVNIGCGVCKTMFCLIMNVSWRCWIDFDRLIRCEY